MSNYIDDLVVENSIDAPLATGTTKGLMSATDKTKIDTVATGATANSPDSFLLDRANHTGTQLSSTISDFSTATDARITLQKGAANGLVPLDSNSKIASNYLPAIAITDTFVVASQAAQTALTAETGDIAVRTDLNKSYILRVNDPSVFANWQELLTPTDSVLSVNGQTGIVVLTTTNISEGSNLYYTQARFDTAFAAKSTTNLTEGTNLYYTQARFDTAFAAKSTSNLTEGSNLYFTTSRVLATNLTGFVASTNTAITSTDTILQAFQKTQAQITAREGTITAGTTAQYWRGDKTFQTLDTVAVTESTNLYYTNARAIAATLTGFVSGSGTVSATDSILTALQKINGNDLLKAPLASPALTGTPTAPTATAGTNTTQIATTAFVTAAIAASSGATTISGDVTGTLASSTVAKIQNRTVAATAPSNGQSIVWNSGTSQWEPQNVSGLTTTSVTVSASNLTLTSSSRNYIVFLGTTPGQSVTMPDATTLVVGHDFYLVNKSSTIISVFKNGGAYIGSIYPEQYLELFVDDISTTAGDWFTETSAPNVLTQSYLFDDFISSGTTSGSIGNLGWTLVAGAGHTMAYVAGTTTEHGILSMGTGTGIAAGYVIHLGNTASVVGGGYRVNEWRVKFPTLATTAQDYSTYIGLSNTVGNTAEFSNGIYFSYSRASSTSWQIKTANGGVRTTTTSAITVAANTWYKIALVVNAAGTQTDFYINNSFVGSITTNIPTNALAPNWTSLKTVGTTDISQTIDYMYDYKNFSAAR